VTLPATVSAPGFRIQSARPVRVLWLIKGLGPGGAELLLSRMADVRDRDRFDYEVAYLVPWKRHLVPDLNRAGLRVHCLDVKTEWDPRWVIRLRRLLTERPFDVVHSHSPYPAGLARLATRSLRPHQRPRLIYTEHVAWRYYSPPTRLLNAATFPLDDAQIAVSPAVKDSLPERTRRRTRVVIHGIDLDRTRADSRFRDEIRKEMGIPEGEMVVGTVANFRAQKDYPNLLDAARYLLDRGLHVRFVAVGQGPLERQIRAEHRRLGFGDRFILAGYRADAARVLAACDVFVLASLFEGLPVALMEAMALGRPVVATAVGGVPEFVSDGVEGLLVPPAAPDALAIALEALLRDPARRRRMGAAAERRAETFDIRKAIGSIESLYLEVVGG
jgi:glycosyltransferase involved in cell wall biosynthesis